MNTEVKTFAQEKEEKAYAIYEVIKTGKTYGLNPTITGHFYRQGINNSYSSDITPLSVKMLYEDTKDGLIRWVKTPKTAYHCWHICTCDKCSPHVIGDIFKSRSSGKVWTHSQSDWDEHLKFVSNELVFTFPSI